MNLAALQILGDHSVFLFRMMPDGYSLRADSFFTSASLKAAAKLWIFDFASSSSHFKAKLDSSGCTPSPPIYVSKK